MRGDVLGVSLLMLIARGDRRPEKSARKSRGVLRLCGEFLGDALWIGIPFLRGVGAGVLWMFSTAVCGEIGETRVLPGPRTEIGEPEGGEMGEVTLIGEDGEGFLGRSLG